MARNRWLTPEMWEFADPDEGDDYALKRHMTWERARKTNSPYAVIGEELREKFRFEGGTLVEYTREVLADSECDA